MGNDKDLSTRIIVGCTCICIALCIALGIEHYKLLEVRQQNMKLELEVRTLTAQTNEITAQWLEMVKRIKNHEVTTR